MKEYPDDLIQTRGLFCIGKREKTVLRRWQCKLDFNFKKGGRGRARGDVEKENLSSGKSKG